MLESIRPLVRFKTSLSREIKRYWGTMRWRISMEWVNTYNWVAVDAHRGRCIPDISPYNDEGLALLGLHHEALEPWPMIGGGCV